MTPPTLWRAIPVPQAFCTAASVDGRDVPFGGDIRMGDLRGCGQADFLVYRSTGAAHDGVGMKPCFLGAFTADGEPIWHQGHGGMQPARPGPVAIHDLDGDGQAEVICFFVDASIEAPADSLADVVIQLRQGATGTVKHQAAPATLRACQGDGANWVHQRIMIANLRGCPTPQDFVVKLGPQLLAFDANLDLLWTYESPWTEYGRCPAYIPAAGDIDGDGRDEVFGGYFLLDHDGTVLWQQDLAPHMDSVTIAPWDEGHMRAIGSGHGLILDAQGHVLLKLGEALVPHGQEVRVGCFEAGNPEPQMVIRCNGHHTDALVVDTRGTVRNRFDLNPSPNNTGMEVVYWNGPNEPAHLYNGGRLWEPLTGRSTPLLDLPLPAPAGRMAWYHCIPADVCGDAREELVLYNPWTTTVYVYTQQDSSEGAYAGYKPGPRQYNARLMD